MNEIVAWAAALLTAVAWVAVINERRIEMTLRRFCDACGNEMAESGRGNFNDGPLLKSMPVEFLAYNERDPLLRFRAAVSISQVVMLDGRSADLCGQCVNKVLNEALREAYEYGPNFDASIAEHLAERSGDVPMQTDEWRRE